MWITQTFCIDALLQVGHSVNAFDLSAQFLHPRGLLEALDLVDADPASGTSLGVGVGLNSRFRELVRVQAAQKGTESVPFATYCMQWLEAKGRPIAALEVGKLAPSQLNLFLEVCLSICSSVCLFVNLPISSIVCLFLCLYVYLLVSVCLSLCLIAFLPVSLPVYLFICLSVCLFLFSFVHFTMRSCFCNITGCGVASVNCHLSSKYINMM